MKLILLTLLSISFAWGSGEKIVLVSHGGASNPFWGTVFNGAKAAAKDLDVKLQILFPNQDGDQPGTTQKLAEAISTNPQAIAVTLGTKSNCEYIKEARNKGVPVLIFNAKAVPPSADCPYEAYVGMDEYLAGKVSAEHALQKGSLSGRVMVGLTEPGHLGLQARAKGISEVMKAKKIQVDVMDLGSDPASIPNRLKGYLQKNQKTLTAVFMPSPQGMHPFLRMLQEDPALSKIYVGAFDLTPLIISGIESGHIKHTIDQQPWLQGYYSVVQLTLALRGKFSPLEMNTGVGLVDKGNAKVISDLVKKGIR